MDLASGRQLQLDIKQGLTSSAQLARRSSRL
jgi:hypothetical protein